MAAAQCAAIEALLERAQPQRDRQWIPDPGRIGIWSERLTHIPIANQIQAAAHTLFARSLALWQRWEEAKDHYQRAVALLLQGEPASGQWADWSAPSALRQWIRLHRIVLPLHVEAPDPDRWIAWQNEALPLVEFIDAERLAAAILQRRLAHRIVANVELRSLANYQDTPLAVEQVHRTTPPLFTQVALGLLACGYGDDAFVLADRRLSTAESTGTQNAYVVAALWAKTQIARRMRMDERAHPLADRPVGARFPANAPDVWPVLALTQPPEEDFSPLPNLPPELLHAYWRSLPALTNAGIELVRNLHTDLLASHSAEAIGTIGIHSSSTELALMLDGVEADWIKTGESAFTQVFHQLDLEAWIAENPDHYEEGLRLLLRAMALHVRTGPIQDNLAQESSAEDERARLNRLSETVGRRRLAELALDEGELLALRLPQHAVNLLDLAHGWFVQAEDHAGAVIAATCCALAALHAHYDRGEEMVNRIHPIYERFRASLSTKEPLPSWAQLLPTDPVESSNVFALIAASDWRGWLYRLCVIRAWIADGQQPGTQTERIRTQLSRHFGPRLPLELDLALDSRREFTKRASPEVFDPPPPPPPEAISIQRILTGETFLELAIMPGPDNMAERLTLSGPIQVRMLLQERERQPDGRRTLAVLAEGTHTITIWQSYQTMAQGIPRKIVEAFERIRPLLNFQTLAIPCTVHAALAGLPWEALLTLTQQPSIEHIAEAPQFWRIGDTGQVTRSQELSSFDKPRVLSLCDRAWKRLVQSGWSPLEGKPNTAESVSKAAKWLRRPPRFSLTDLLIGTPARSPFIILHLIGTPVQTSAGLRLQVQGRSRLLTKVANSNEGTIRGVDTLVGADSLPLSDVQMVVLQAEPAETRLRSNTERAQMADLRALAAEFFRSGVPVVLVLPALASRVGTLVLQEGAKEVAHSHSFTVQNLIRAIDNAQALIAGDLPLDIPPDTRLELLLDICLLAHSLP
jgi:hypothetical protein